MNNTTSDVLALLKSITHNLPKANQIRKTFKNLPQKSFLAKPRKKYYFPPKKRNWKRGSFWFKRNRVFKRFVYNRGRKRVQIYGQRLRFFFKKLLSVRTFYRIYYNYRRNRPLKQLLHKNKFNSYRFDKFLTRAESRLAKVLLRARFADTFKTAIFLIKNGYVFVNNKKYLRPNLILNQFDVVNIDPIIWYNICYRQQKYLQKIQHLSYLEIDYTVGNLIFTRQPVFRDFRFSKIVKKQYLNRFFQATALN